MGRGRTTASFMKLFHPFFLLFSLDSNKIHIYVIVIQKIPCIKLNFNQVEKKRKFLNSFLLPHPPTPWRHKKLILFREAQKAGPGDQVRAISALEFTSIQMVPSPDTVGKCFNFPQVSKNFWQSLLHLRKQSSKKYTQVQKLP